MLYDFFENIKPYNIGHLGWSLLEVKGVFLTNKKIVPYKVLD